MKLEVASPTVSHYNFCILLSLFLFLPVEQLEFVLLNFISKFLCAFFIITFFSWWWWSIIIRLKRFWGPNTENAVLGALASFLLPNSSNLTTIQSRFHTTEQAFSFNISRWFLLPHWFFSHCSLYQVSEASFSLSPCLSSSLVSASLCFPAHLCDCAALPHFTLCVLSLSLPPPLHPSGSLRWVAFLAGSQMSNNLFGL